MSALPPKADIHVAQQYVRLVPIADSYQSFLRLFSVTFGQQRVDFKICLLGRRDEAAFHALFKCRFQDAVPESFPACFAVMNGDDLPTTRRWSRAMEYLTLW